MNDMSPDDYFSGEPPEVVEPATLERLSFLAEESKRLETEIAADTVALAEKQGQLDKILRERIPNIMDELGMADYTMKDGSAISVKDDVKCGITEANKPAAWAWLEEREYDGIIKTIVSVSFGKGEMEKAKAAMASLKQIGYDADLNRSVHPSTLKSFVRERLEDGEAIPVETFGIFEFRIAKIKLPPKPRARR